MTVVFQIKDVDGWYTTDPEVVPHSHHIKKGDYVKLPNGRVFQLEMDYPTKFTEVSLDRVPAGVKVLNAQEYDMCK